MSLALHVAAWMLMAAATCRPAEPPPVPVTTLAFTPDGIDLVSNGARCLQVRSGSDGAPRRRLDCDLPKISAVAFHPRQPLLAVAGGVPGVSGELRLLDWPSGGIRFRATNDVDLLLGIAFNEDGSLLAAAGADQTARVWRASDDPHHWRNVLLLSGHAGPVTGVAFSPGGQEITTAGADRSLKVWSLQDGRLLRSLNRHTDRINALLFRPGPTSISPASPLCASAGDDRTVRVWQPGISRMVRIIRGHGGPVLALALSPDGGSLFSAGSEGIVRHLDPDSDRIRAEWTWHSDWIHALAVSPDGTRIASGDWSGRVRVERIPGRDPDR